MRRILHDAKPRAVKPRSTVTALTSQTDPSADDAGFAPADPQQVYRLASGRNRLLCQPSKSTKRDSNPHYTVFETVASTNWATGGGERAPRKPDDATHATMPSTATQVHFLDTLTTNHHTQNQRCINRCENKREQQKPRKRHRSNDDTPEALNPKRFENTIHGQNQSRCGPHVFPGVPFPTGGGACACVRAHGMGAWAWCGRGVMGAVMVGVMVGGVLVAWSASRRRGVVSSRHGRCDGVVSY